MWNVLVMLLCFDEKSQQWQRYLIFILLILWVGSFFKVVVRMGLLLPFPWLSGKKSVQNFSLGLYCIVLLKQYLNFMKFLEIKVWKTWLSNFWKNELHKKWREGEASLSHWIMHYLQPSIGLRFPLYLLRKVRDVKNEREDQRDPLR